jgi:hypothetical protein
MVLGIEVAILRVKWLLSCVSRRVGRRFDSSRRVVCPTDMQILPQGAKSQFILVKSNGSSIA